MQNLIFREYDIRGIIGTELKIKESYLIATSIISYFKKKNSKINKVIVARDGRNSSPEIRDQVVAAINDLGVDVLDIGICPTPTFYFSLFNTEVTSGVIITASHNPSNYNGMKICLNRKSLFGKEIQEIKTIYQTKKIYKPSKEKIGSVEYLNIIPTYVDWLTNHFKHLKNYNIGAIIDCGNGTGGTVLPSIIKKMNWENVKLLFDDLDGNFPNHQADPTNIKNMQDVAVELKNNSKFELGLGLDGDADRMDPITKNGYLVPGDQLLAIFAQKVLKDFPGATVVFDIKASSSLIELLKKWGAIDHICPSGHSLIKKALLETNAKLAGELSCHFFFNDRYFGYDDGIYSILRLFEILKESGKSLDELINIFPKKELSPEIRIRCKEEDKNKIVNAAKRFFTAKKDTKNITIDGIRSENKDGWGLIRASNTQPVISLRFEATSRKGLKNIKQSFYDSIKYYFNQKELKDKIEL